MGPDTSPLGRLASFAVRRSVIVLLLWIAAATALNVAVPQLEQVVQRDSSPFVPPETSAIVAQKQMSTAFGDDKSNSYAYVVMRRAGGLTKADLTYYKHVAADLKTIDDVTDVRDLSADERAMDSVTSKDGEARYLVVGMSGQTGAPQGSAQIEHVRHAAHEGVPEGLDVAVTGVSATIADSAHHIESKLGIITVATVILIAAILTFFYRSVVVTAIGLTLIGLTLATARAVVAWCGLHVFAVSTFTGSFLTGVVVGAATDYFVFTLNRYYDGRRAGQDARTAAMTGSAKISPVIIGSAVTVMLANAALLTADIAFYRTTGPAMSVAIAVALLACLTATPALLALAGSRGWVEPPVERAAAYWKRMAQRVIARPSMMLAYGLTPLLALAAFAPFIAPVFDQTRNQPDSTESNHGYRLLSDHFPADEVGPEFLVITSPRDLRTTKALAALEQMAIDVAKVDGVTQVRGITRPGGSPLDQASVGSQAGVVGDRLGDAAGQIAAGTSDTARLTDGAGQLSSGAIAAADGSRELLSGIDRLRNGVTELDTGASDALNGSNRLVTGTDQLADGLEFAASQTAVAVTGLGQVYTALQGDLLCTVDPICAQARAGLAKIYAAERDQLLPGLQQAARAARDIANGSVSLRDGLARLDAGLAKAHTGANQLAAGQKSLSSGLDTLADGADQVQVGTQQTAESFKELQTALEAASAYLRELRDETDGSPTAGGFHIPASYLSSADFAAASQLLISPDGHTARYLVLSDKSPFTRAAMERSQQVEDAARDSLASTSLSGAELRTTGQASFNIGLRDLNEGDFLRTMLVALVTIGLILLALLRAPWAALFLVSTVVLSYAAALGLGVLIWQELLHTPLDWTVPSISFILLVAVGADYNLLLMKRAKEYLDVGYDARLSMSEAVATTGSVITTAGLIFAASMLALLAGNITAVSQTGSIVALGLLLDTFVVRTLLVPAGAVLIGPKLWWPKRA